MLSSLLALAALSAVPTSSPAISGRYVEARTCDVWTGPCFANADFNIGGKNAVLAWRVDHGSLDGVSLDGLGVVAVLAAGNTLGLDQVAPARTVIIVDNRATSAQRDALIRLARRQGGKLLDNVVAVQSAPVRFDVCNCKGDACTELVAGAARITTRCLDAEHDKACGNESAYYPPLAGNVTVRPAAAVESAFTGTGLQETWRDFDRRGAYVGSFAVR